MVRQKNIKNLKTEKEGIRILLDDPDLNFYIPDSSEKKIILKLMGINQKRFMKTFDGLILKVDNFDDIKSINDFDMIEMKSTKRKQDNFPFGSFFGFTLNEESLLRVFDNYKLCIVHTVTGEYDFFNFEKYESLILRKRIQYQIDFKKKN